LTNPARNRRKERESNPQGSSLVRVRAGCRRQSACPSVSSSSGGRNRTCVPPVNSRVPVPARAPPESSHRTVGMAGFEPAISCSQGRRIGQAFLHPESSRSPTSAQRESNPHVRHGEAVGYRYIMGTFAVPGLSKIESTGWDSNPRRRLTSAGSSPLDDQCLLRSGTGGARTLTEPVKSRTFCR
jgi:hypothetical protein